jgi:hypothetical protein
MCRKRNVLCEIRHKSVYGNSNVVQLSLVFLPAGKAVRVHIVTCFVSVWSVLVLSPVSPCVCFSTCPVPVYVQVAPAMALPASRTFFFASLQGQAPSTLLSHFH